MTTEKLEQLVELKNKIESLESMIDAILNGPYGNHYSYLRLDACYKDDPNGDNILIINQDNFPGLKGVILNYLRGEHDLLKRRFEEA